MSQLHLPDDLAHDVEAIAAEQGKRAEDWASAVLRHAVERARGGTPAGSLRERLRQAGLLVHVQARDLRHPTAGALDGARRLAAQGRPLSEYISDGRE